MASSDFGTYTRVVELVALGFETGFEIAQTFSISQLCESHAAFLLLTGESLDVPVAVVALNTPAKSILGQEVYRL